MMIIPAEAKGLFAELNTIDPGPKGASFVAAAGFSDVLNETTDSTVRKT